MIEEEVEIPPKKTHSIVTHDCQLRIHHYGEQVTYKGVEGWLIRYIPECEHVLLELTISEARECLEQNTSSVSSI